MPNFIEFGSNRAKWFL